MRIDSAGLTDTGCARENNEDAFLADAGGGVFLVADGMGGLEAGEVVSSLAVKTVAKELLPPGERESASLAEGLKSRMVTAFEEANDRIRRFAMDGPGLESTGTTLVGLVRCGESFVLGNVGDSRAYLIRAGSIRLLTEDHSLVMAQVRSGLMTREEAARSPERNIIYRALGMAARLEVDTWIIPAAPGDSFLLCSDGLSDVLADRELLDIANQGAADAPQDVCARCIALALDRKARDNITVVLARCLP